MFQKSTFKKAVFVFIFFAAGFTISAENPKNIIFLIGDGMGLAQIQAGMTANGGRWQMERCPFSGFSKTASASDYITDSAAGGTALACGVKTSNGMVGMTPDTVPVPSVLELSAQKKGKATGVVVVCSVTHATPASFVAHQDSRTKDEAIAADYLKAPIDVFIGGGLKFFNNRSDGRNLVHELQAKGYTVATTMNEVKAQNSGKLAGLVAEEHPGGAEERKGMLEEATLSALKILGKNKNGFFLMIEGSQIDWTCHDNSESRLIPEMLDFNKTLKAVLDFAEKDGNTLVIITADHETGGLTIIDGNYATKEVRTIFNTTHHTGIMVPVFSYGPQAERFSGIQENTDISKKIKKIWKLD